MSLGVLLAVNASAMTAQYFRFTPTAYAGVDAYNLNLGIDEIELYNGEGVRITWPAGTTVTSDSTAHTGYAPLSSIVNGEHNEKCIIFTSSIQYPYVMISSPQPLSFESYGWWTCTYSGGDAPRVATAWKFEVSGDGENWIEWDVRSGYPGFELKQDGYSEYRGKFRPSVELTINEGETYVLDAAKATNLDGGSITLKGTLDLNGVDLNVELINNLHELGQTSYLNDNEIVNLTGAAIINSAPEPAKLTAGRMLYAGAVTETGGQIDIVLTSGTSWFYGTAGSIAPTSIETTGGAVIQSVKRPFLYCFRFLRTRGGKPPALGEVIMLRDGHLLDERLRGYIGASPSSEATDHGFSMLTDGNYGTWWSATEEDEDPRLRITTDYLRASLDGYVLAAPADADAAPCDWDLYGCDEQSWFLLDSRRNETLGDRDGVYAGGRLSKAYRISDFAGRCACPFGESTLIKLNGGGSVSDRLRAFSDYERAGGVAGSLNVYVGSCSTFHADVFTDWTGSFRQEEGQCHDYVSMSRLLIGDGMNLNARIRNPRYANFTIEAASGEANLLIDDNWPDDPVDSVRPQFGRLADGAGRLGIVKRGTKRRILETKDSSNTGATAVEEGVLEVRGDREIDYHAYQSGRSARYFRMTPLSYPYQDSYNYNFGISEIELLDADSNVIAWPAGTVATTDAPVVIGSALGIMGVIDGKKGEKLILRTQWADADYPRNPYPYVQIDAGEEIAFRGWRWWTTEHDNNAGGRIATGWKLEISHDGEHWMLADYVAAGSGGWANATVAVQPWPPVESFTGTTEVSVEETVETAGETHYPEFDAAFMAPAEGARATRYPGIRSRYLRFWTVATVADMFERPNGVPASADDGGELAELALFYKGERVAWPAGTSYLGGDASAVNVFDGDPSTTFHWTGSPRMVLNIDAGEELVFDEVAFVSANAEHSYRRLPAIWNLYVSTDRTQWVNFHNGGVNEAANYDTTPGATLKLVSMKNRLPMLGAGANDALGDEAPVEISAGATLAINADYEKFGALSGAGALELVYGATAEANATEESYFAGDIKGAGTFVASGAETLTLAGDKSFRGTLEVGGKLALEDAVFTEVTDVKLVENGQLSGAGSFGEDVSVTFDGGALDAVLTVEGELTVSGAPAIVPPDGAGLEWEKTVFRAKTISSATRAVIATATHPYGSAQTLRFTYAEQDGYTVCKAVVKPNPFLILVK